MSLPKKSFKRASGPQMAVRRVRIMTWLQSGMSYEEIAGLEGLTRQRIRQIIVAAMKEKQDDLPVVDLRTLHEFRLEPALRLAAKAIVEGKLEGVDRLVKVIGQLGKLRPEPPPRKVYDADARRRLLAKLNLNYEKILDKEEREAAARGFDYPIAQDEQTTEVGAAPVVPASA